MKQNQDPKRYINKTDITYTTKQAISKQCKAYGYLDGYYDGVIYEEYIGLTVLTKTIMQKVI